MKHLFCTDKNIIANTHAYVSFEFDNNSKVKIKSDLLFNCKYKDGCESLFASNDKNHLYFNSEVNFSGFLIGQHLIMLIKR